MGRRSPPLRGASVIRLIARWATPAAILLTLVALYALPEVGGIAMAALVCAAIALAFTP